MKTFTFYNKDTMPALGLGTWKSEPGEVEQAVIAAIKAGYRHIDCAAIYGNENEVGAGIKQCIADGIVTRDELWVTSKLWNNAHKKEDVKPALKKTLDDLSLEYIDLYLMHWPIAFEKEVEGFPNDASDFLSLDEVPLKETWLAMEGLRNDGLAKHIGVSNCSEKKLEHLLKVGNMPPELNQVELHPMLQQQQLVDFCHKNDIHVTAYSPLGSLDRPESAKQNDEPVPMENSTIKSIAKDHDASPAQILISWALHRDTAVIPKSTNSERIKENFEAQKISLTDQELNRIKELDLGQRIIDGVPFTMEGNSYTLENLWDE